MKTVGRPRRNDVVYSEPVWPEKAIGIIYCLTNNDNGKKYVGQTINHLEVRVSRHFSRQYNYMKINQALLEDRRLGKWSAEVIQFCYSKEELLNREEYWIKELNTVQNGYNTLSGFVPKDNTNENLMRRYEITFPDGHNEVIKGITKFCRKYNLSRGSLMATIEGGRAFHKGFKAKRLAA
jgi:hypothetical protein